MARDRDRDAALAAYAGTSTGDIFARNEDGVAP